MEQSSIELIDALYEIKDEKNKLSVKYLNTENQK